MNTALAHEEFLKQEYKYGFVTDIASIKPCKGLNEEVIRFISNKKSEPAWMLERRLTAYKTWVHMQEPNWSTVKYPKIDFQDIYYYSEPKAKKKLKSLDEVDPELLKTYKKLGISINEQKVLAGVAVDVIFDSISVATTYKETLKKNGVIFCPISEAIREHPE